MEFIWNGLWHTLLNLLVAINSVVNVPGVSIIIFTIFIRLLTVPLTMKSLKSNRNMQQIQPLIKEVQKKYKDDKQKQQEETMRLYQEYGINPAAGCFPMLVQIPVFFALFAALQFTLTHGGDASQLRPILWNESWVPFANFGKEGFLWIPSLAAHDPLYIWPVLSGLFQFIQNRMAMPKRDPNAPQDTQQKMMNGMMQFMPIYIVFISLTFPAGNVIYWAFSSIFGAVQQYFITGFGTLPDFPGLGWLPRKQLAPAKPLHPLTEGGAPIRPVKKNTGVMGKMMQRALEAQEQQRIAAEQTKADAEAQRVAGKRSGATSRPAREGAATATASGATTTRVRKTSEQHIKIVPSPSKKKK